MNLRHLKPEKDHKNSRASYSVRKDDFIGWVNSLGVERTWAGRVANNLDTRFNLRRAAWIFLFALGLSFLVSLDFQSKFPAYEEGVITTEDIRSPLTFEFVDQIETQARRLEAEKHTPAVYDLDSNVYQELENRVRRSFRSMRDVVGEVKSRSSKKETERFFLTHHLDFETDLGVSRISEATFNWLTENRFKQSIENSLVRALEQMRDMRVVADKQDVTTSPDQLLIVNLLERGLTSDGFTASLSTVIDVRELKKRFSAEADIFRDLGEKGSVAVAELLRSLISPNLTLNKQETEVRKQKARESVSPVVVKKKKGELIVAAKASIQSTHVRIIDEIRSLQTKHARNSQVLIMALFLTTVLLCFLAYISRFVTHVVVTVKDSIAMGSIIVLLVVGVKFFLFVSSAAFVEKFAFIPQSFYLYMMPVSSASMLVGLLLPFGEVVWLFSLFTSVVMGLVTDSNYAYMVICFTSSIVAARGVYGCKKRDQLYLAGAKTGLITALLIFCATLITGAATFSQKELIWNSGAGFLSGIFASFLCLTLVPFWETLFNYTTDVRLLELSNLNHPLLKDLIVKAPGTYHHSLIVANMCEAAAEGIGANPLLAKVTSFYHDIGKMLHPQYFIENQRRGENKHDHISPGMSKTVLVAHVKDGVELGQKFKLGKAILDVIEQHHGTTLISFFYHRAKEKEDPEMCQVTENEYRYPGPKPQFREAALCMLADSIEAAARSLDEPTPARLQGIVRNIVQKKFLDGQLDECDLTLRDLTTIEETFSRILLGIYHHRIDYPTFPTPKA